MRKMKCSEATLRARAYANVDNDWYCSFRLSEVHGIGYEEGVHRRDPSSIIEYEGQYYVYYTKSVGSSEEYDGSDVREKRFPWDYADIYYATSVDGIHWDEQGIAVGRGSEGSYDERTLCTPDVMVYQEMYYLVYQCKDMSGEYIGTDEKIGMAYSSNPNGPWTKLDAPILEKRHDGYWFGESKEDSGTYNDCEFEGTVHDPMLFEFKGKFLLYYKCLIQKDRSNLRTINKSQGGRHGVAIADHIEGPYIASEYNPVTNSGHETLLWKYKAGIACLLIHDGPEANTIQYTKDGVNFSIMSKVDNPPPAAGAFRTDDVNTYPLVGIQWGVYHPEYDPEIKWDYIARFEQVKDMNQK